VAARARTIGHVAGTTNRNGSEGRISRARNTGPTSWGGVLPSGCPAPTVPGTFRIMVGAADVLGLKPITPEVALRDAAARLRA
jgi:hypothetical protein